jgi:hypothetical protein
MVAANLNEPRMVAGRKKLAEFIRKLQADKKTVEFLDTEKKVACFNGDNGMNVVFEQQPDKRWCFRAGAPKPQTQPATTPATTSTPTK